MAVQEAHRGADVRHAMTGVNHDSRARQHRGDRQHIGTPVTQTENRWDVRSKQPSGRAACGSRPARLFRARGSREAADADSTATATRASGRSTSQCACRGVRAVAASSAPWWRGPVMVERVRSRGAVRHTRTGTHTALSPGMTPNPAKRMRPAPACVLTPSCLPEATRPLLQVLQYALDDHAQLGASRVRIRRGRGWPRPELVYEITISVGELVCTYTDYDLDGALLGAFERTYQLVDEHWHRIEHEARVSSARPPPVPANEWSGGGAGSVRRNPPHRGERAAEGVSSTGRVSHATWGCSSRQ